jgi:UDP-N-acetylmuramate--alanine ligase
VVYDDYGHHPTAIRETLGAIRQREPGRRVWAVYEPLTYHRTAAMLDAFADVARDGRCGRDRRHLGGARSGHHDPSAADLAEAVSRRRPDLEVLAPATSRRPPTRSRRGSGP